MISTTTTSESPSGGVSSGKTVPDELFLKYAPIVDLVVRHHLRRLHPFFDLDDMRSCGLIGLHKAFQRGDPDSPTFLSFVKMKVQGAILDEYRKLIGGRRLVKERLLMKKAVTKLSAELHRDPSDSELREELRIPKTEWNQWKESAKPIRFESIDRTWHDVDDSGSFSDHVIEPIDPAPFPSQILERSNLMEHLHTAINSLPSRERTILIASLEDETHVAIGCRHGLSKTRIGQIRRKVEQDLKSFMEAVS